MKMKVILANVSALVVALFLIPLFVLFFFPVVFLPAQVRFRCRFFYAATSGLIATILWVGRLRYRMVGQEKLKILEKTGVIIVANHQSVLDALIFETLLGPLPRIFITNDYSKIPIVGTILTRMHVIVRRVSAQASKQVLDDAIKLARDFGPHIIIFPEGTRYADGEIHKFYRGFAVLAESLGWPIVPVFLSGVYSVMPRGQKFLEPRAEPITIHVGDPLVFDPSRESQEEFLAKVHNWFTLENSKVRCRS